MFFLLLGIESIFFVYIFIKIFDRKKSIWPPRSKDSKITKALIVIFYFIVLGNIWLCIKEWNNPLFNTPWVRYFGILIFILGLILYAWCRLYMSKKMEFGGKDHLITQGPYQYTRNPLYIADTFIFLGFALFSNSLLVIILMVLLVLTLLLLPLIEEPWLLEQYGEQYKSYLEKVPRYIKI